MSDIKNSHCTCRDQDCFPGNETSCGEFGHQPCKCMGHTKFDLIYKAPREVKDE
jgi:hypothetical protein